MHPALVPMLGLSGQAGFTLAAAGLLNAPAILSRAQGTSTATALGLDGATWQNFGANLPRFGGAARRLLIEGQRTNGIRNPRGEGALTTTLAAGVGAGSSVATHWWAPNRGANLALDIAPVSAFGMTGVRLRYYGTTSAAPIHETVEFEARNVFGATSAAAVTGSFFYRLVSVSLPVGTQPTARIITMQADGATPVTVSPSPSLLMDGTLRRAAHTVTPGANSAFASLGLHLQAWPANTACDFSVDLFWPQLEQGNFASTPILPPVGTPGASTRGPDLLTASLPLLGIGPNGACTVLWTSTHAAATAVNGWETLVEINDGSAANRFGIQRPINSTTARGFRSLAGASGVTADAAVAPSAVTRYGVSIDGAGRLALSVNGAAPVAVTGGPTSGLTTLRLGSEHSGGAPLFGEYGVARVIPGAMSDAALQAQVAALA